jgi:cytochrome c553
VLIMSASPGRIIEDSLPAALPQVNSRRKSPGLPWEICGECHGLDGVSPVARFPSLAGQRPAYIVKQLRDFRDGRRANDGGQMAANVSDIGEADLAKALAYFSALLPRVAYWPPGHFIGGPEIFGGGTHIWSGEAVEDSRVLF